MNVNLLQDNPDWRWYILFGCLSLVMTVAIWVLSKCLPVSIVDSISIEGKTDFYLLEHGARYSDTRVGQVFRQKERQDEFKFFSVIIGSFWPASRKLSD